MKRISSSLFVLLICLSACSSERTYLDAALGLAGENRMELEKVLTHYNSPDDSLKYRAACFLIEAMPNYYYYEGDQLDQYNGIYRALVEVKDAEAVIDSFRLRYGDFSASRLKVKYDIKEIEASYLIRNIDWAFKVWKEQPWCRNISFADFCTYILPYKLNDEQPTEWRQYLYEKYNPLLDSLRCTEGADDPLKTAQVILKRLSLEDKYFTGLVAHIPLATPLLLDDYKTGSCREVADYTVYVLRALGIPCGVDFIPAHGRVNTSHYWTFILDKKGDTYTSDYLDSIIAPATQSLHVTSKIYRETFDLNKKLRRDISKHIHTAPAFFASPHFFDVTEVYAPTHSVTIAGKDWYSGKRPPLVFLCANRFQQWVPVEWALVKEGKAVFHSIKTEYSTVLDTLNHGFPARSFHVLPEVMQTYFDDILHRVARWEDGELKFETDPFLINHKGETEFIRTNGEKENICLFSKFDPFTDAFVQHMPGSLFEGSNDRYFSNPDTLFQIKEVPMRLWNTQPIHSNQKYRYIRYKGAVNTSCSISEIRIYADSVLLKGTAYGSIDGKEIDKHGYINAFDGDSYTSFYSPNPSGDWVAIDLGKPYQIDQIIYTPRNRDNFIRTGDRYDLFYLEKDQWRSLGIQIAQADSLLFKDAPVNALFYLKNYTRGNDERVFLMKEGYQVFF